MSEVLRALSAYLVNLGGEFSRGWSRFWFEPRPPTTLGMIRICTGLVLLYVHLTTLPWLQDIVGPEAWIDQQATRELTELPNSLGQKLEQRADQYAAALGAEGLDDVRRHIASQVEWSRWYAISVWRWVQDPTAIWVGHGLFIVALFAFTLGLFSRVAAVLVWYGHLSYIQRGYLVWYGMDAILLMLTFYLMFAPIGGALALDCLRRRRTGEPVNWFGQPAWTVTVVTRLIQIHMCIVYLCAGISKLQGPTWWNGTATWITMNTYEFLLFDMRWLGTWPDLAWQVICTSFTYATLIFEIGFCFCVWSRRLRPIVLFAALLLHAGIGAFMGLTSFGLIMLTACLSFVEPAGMQWFVSRLWPGTQTSPPVPPTS
ncbi:MAG TPA: HTTM domain-containing protein [Gemmatales bacterium]|nr:HTTM domain-containing protein [Gemmatales bacterium]HMP58357.1 HTTM domain-containing protein [Gemmatales bacterium]